MAVKLELPKKNVWKKVAKPESIHREIRIALDNAAPRRRRERALSALRAVISFYRKEKGYDDFIQHIHSIRERARREIYAI